ncbi:MAG: ferrochelatase [Myxococcales bacterium]|nr:MAG: ferrochelatase [Myxococcales bacterium]
MWTVSSELSQYDALLLLSFGGPDGPDDVLPFLKRVVQGRNVPEARLAEVAERYMQFGGKSPINELNEALIQALRVVLEKDGPHLPIYYGNRNWHPLLEDTLRRMRGDGIKHALAFVTSAYSSYSGCRQYLENIETARAALGEDAPMVTKIRPYFNHPYFIKAVVESARASLAAIQQQANGATVAYAFTAHSIPQAMSAKCDYLEQLNCVASLVAHELGIDSWKLIFQSRSGPPHLPWLEPDVNDYLRPLRKRASRMPGFVLLASFRIILKSFMIWILKLSKTQKLLE